MRYRGTHLRSDSAGGGIRLAPGVRLSQDKEHPEADELVVAGGKVQLNRSAAAILELCNGSRNRDRLLADLLRSSSGLARVSDVGEFLDTAKALGWIIES